MIDVSHIEPAELLRLLYNAIDMGKRHGLPTFPDPMRIEEARRIIAERTRDGIARFDYLNGRLMKVAIGSAQVDERLYDREHGPGAFATAIGVEYVQKDEHMFFRLDGDKLVPCDDYGDFRRERAKDELGQRLRGASVFLLSKRERRQRSRRRPKSKRMLGIPKEQPLIEFAKPIHTIMLIAHRFGVGARVEDRRLPRDMWPEIRRYATVYIEQGRKVPGTVEDEVVGMLKRSAMEAGQKMYEQLKYER